MATRNDRKRERRNLNPISLSFLDVMSCGFGAVVLIFLIIDHNNDTFTETTDSALSAEVSLLREDINEGEENLAAVRNTIDDVDMRIAEAQGMASRIQEEVEQLRDERDEIQRRAGTSEDDIQSVREDIAALEVEVEEMREAGEENQGENIRQHLGEGNRQYLTGMVMGGNRILILVDMSSSMLDDTIVNIIRRRNMSEQAQREAPKWRQVVDTVDWITTQLPPASRYQIYAFNDSYRPLVSDTAGSWLEVADQEQLNQAVATMEEIVPSNGTNLEQLFMAVRELDPLPDNIFLITDGLPTLDNQDRQRNTVSGRQREQLFNQAIQELPGSIPVNVILMPLEGDPMAASAYWQLAIASGGAFLTPAEDWP